MTWTKEPPKEPGFYFLWSQPNGWRGYGWRSVVEFKRTPRGLADDQGDGPDYYQHALWWSEPIKAPDAPPG